MTELLITNFNYNPNIIHNDFKIKHESDGSWLEYIEDIKPDDIEEQTDIVIKLKSGIVIYKCWLEFIKPYWDLANYVETGMVNLLSVNYGDLSKKQLRYYVKKCSFLSLILENDSNGYEYIKNVDDLTGKNGLHPSIINIIYNKIK